ncbi:MAG TPA: hypothetical protein PK041_11015 [Kaistella sp.]|nr:hypothetical protein [Kaistella sp.]
MKKIIFFTTIFLGILFSYAQAPNSMSYQAVVRNASNALVVNQNVGIRTSILQGSETGTVIYKENQTAATNQNGLFSISIGSGVPLTGTFSSIDWSTGGPYFIKSEIDPTGGSNYTISSTSRMMSVPYALYAKTAGSASNGLSLPYSGTAVSNNTAFKIINNGTSNSSTAIAGDASGAGTAISASAESGSAIHAESSTGSAVYGFSSSGKGGEFATDGNSAGVSGFSSDGPGGEFSSNNGTAVKANGNVDITGTVKIAGGDPGKGKVLTSDASGNATWKAAAYNNLERFFFKYNNLYGFKTIYNTGTASATALGTVSNVITIHISKPGLYHFDFNGFGYTSGSDYLIYVITLLYENVSYQKVGLNKDYYLSSFSQSIDVFIPEAYDIKFSTAGFNIDNSSYTINVLGHLISE